MKTIRQNESTLRVAKRVERLDVQPRRCRERIVSIDTERRKPAVNLLPVERLDEADSDIRMLR